MKKITHYLLTLILLFSVNLLFAQRHGSVEGVVKDATSGEFLPYTSVALVGTSLGTITQADGSYTISNVPAGNYSLRVSFVGYQENSANITVAAGKVTRQNMELSFTSIMGEEVVITATAMGQVKAINTQIASNTIKNVVSEQKIRELPDANVAEALSRLPGVSVNRYNGEAVSVTIRGVGSNSMYVNGMRMSGGLGGISASMVGGIEVSKAFLPDQDADVLGGTVDFKMREARSGFNKEIWARTGYNGFTKSFKMHDVSALISNRFFDDKLGVMLSVNWDRKDRGRDGIGADYSSVGSSKDAYTILPVKINAAYLTHTETLNDRYGATLYSDYRLKNGKLFVQSFLNYVNSDALTLSNYYFDHATQYLTETYTDKSYNLLSGVGGEHKLFNLLEVDWNASYSVDASKSPDQMSYMATNSALTGMNTIDTTSTIRDWMNLTNHDMNRTDANVINLNKNESGGDEVTAKLDVKVPFSLGQQVSGYFKVGGKYRDLSRYNGASMRFGEIRRDGTQKLGVYAVERLPDYNWTYSSTGFMGHQVFALPESEWEQDFTAMDDTKIYFPADMDKVSFIAETVSDKMDESVVAEVDDFKSTEIFLAGYAMAEFNVGNLITFTPGVRYEENTYETTAKYFASSIPYGPRHNQGEMYDTTGKNTIDRLFPMIHLKVKPTSWFDIRLAYTETVSRPYYTSISPRYYRSIYFDLNKGNMKLRPQINYNYDLYLSFYPNKLGLFTAGVFYKKMVDQVLDYTVRIMDPADYDLTPAFKGKNLTTPINNDTPGYVRGIEIDWQTQFSYLPKPFNGIVLNANVTYMQSETAYPFYTFQNISIPDPPYRIQVGEKVTRDNKITGMPDWIGNVSLGYEAGGFSGRISAYYQSRTITRAVASDISTDKDRDKLLRFDLQLSQKLAKVPGLTFYLNVNNLTNNVDAMILTHHPDRFGSREKFGTAADIGVRYKF